MDSGGGDCGSGWRGGGRGSGCGSGGLVVRSWQLWLAECGVMATVLTLTGDVDSGGGASGSGWWGGCGGSGSDGRVSGG